MLKHIDNGSYGKIFSNDEKTKIVKEISLFKNKTLCSNTLRELNMYGLFSKLNINCPYVMKIEDVHFKKDKVYLKMDNGGITLVKWLSQYHHLLPTYFSHLFKCIAKALLTIHKLGYVHGDIKPENIVISEHITPKLIDFGSSVPYGRVTSYCMCTKLFKDPSLSFRNCVYHEKSDIFSFSLVLGYMISQDYFIDDRGEYNYEKFCEKIHETPFLEPPLKNIIKTMGHPDINQRSSFEDLQTFINEEEEQDDKNKNNDELQLLSEVPDSTKKFIHLSLKKINYEEYTLESYRTMKLLYHVNNDYNSKLYATIIFMMKIAFFDRAIVEVELINHFLPLSYTVDQLKKCIIDTIVHIRLLIL